MANVTYTTLFSEVIPHVPGCPVDIATNAIRAAAIDLCDRSGIIEYDAPLITPADQQATYVPTLPNGTIIAQINKAWYDGLELEPKDSDFLTKMYGDWQSINAGTPRWITMTPADLTTVRLVPAPSNPAAGVIFRLRLTLKPSRASVDFDPNVAETYTETIAHGALARLMAVPGKPYSNERLAAYHAGLFNDGVRIATIRANKGMTRESMRVQFPKIY
jgi:hypothetical protein